MSNEILGIERTDPTPTADMFVAVLKGVFGALVPPVGQGIEAFANWRSRVKQERINEFFNEAINKVDKDKVDYGFLRTDEFGDMLEDILVKVAANRSDAKKAYFRKVLLSAIEGHPRPDMSRVFINILGEITDAELQLLAQIHNVHRQGRQLQQEGKEVDLAIQIEKDRKEIFGIHRSQYLIIVQSLIRKGLLVDLSFGRWDASPYDFIGINDLGVQFCEYISHT